MQTDDFLSIEIHELDRKKPFGPNHDLITNSPRLPPPFDFERLIRFMSYGFIMSPVQYHWFAFLTKAFPLAKGAGGLVQPLKRTACDQLIMAPIGMRVLWIGVGDFVLTLQGLSCFYTFMTVAEGGGSKAVRRKFEDAYLPTLKANWLIWPAVQLINFKFMPLQFQIVRRLERVPFERTFADCHASLLSRQWELCGRRTYRSRM